MIMDIIILRQRSVAHSLLRNVIVGLYRWNMVHREVWSLRILSTKACFYLDLIRSISINIGLAVWNWLRYINSRISIIVWLDLVIYLSTISIMLFDRSTFLAVIVNLKCRCSILLLIKWRLAIYNVLSLGMNGVLVLFTLPHLFS